MNGFAYSHFSLLTRRTHNEVVWITSSFHETCFSIHLHRHIGEPEHEKATPYYSTTSTQSEKQPPEVFYVIGVLKSFANFTGKKLCWSFFLIVFNRVPAL